MVYRIKSVRRLRDDRVVRLTAVTLEGFQSYREPCTIELDRHLTLLAGRNNVGKSAFLRAMQVFTEQQEGAADNFAITYRWIASVAELESRGFPVDHLPTSGDQTVSARHEQSGHQGTIGSHGGPQPLLTRVEIEGAELAATRTGTAWNWETEHPGFEAKLMLSLVPVRGPNVRFVAPRRINQGPRHLQTASELLPDAANLTEVVFTLRANHSQTLFAEVQRAMRKSFPDIAELTVSMQEQQSSGATGEIAVIYKSDKSRHVPLRLCGSGVEQMLALVVGIVTAREPCVFLIDEPQAFLHPHAERMLLETIDHYDGHQYVIATHSNFLLGARPLAQARLLSASRGVTQVTSPTDAGSVLSGLGLTAADLWLPDFVLWGEGSSEVAALSLLSEELPAGARRAIRIRQMPAPASAFTGSPSRQGRALFAFCDEVTGAVASASPETAFVFDLDEKSAAERTELVRASRGRARFLSVRELENYFLDAEVITPVLNAVLSAVGMQSTTKDIVAEHLDSLLADTTNKKLYPGAKDKAQVRGSEVLRTLWWDFASAPYEKPRYAEALCNSAILVAPSRLDPLRQVLRDAFTSPSARPTSVRDTSRRSSKRRRS